MKGEDPEISQGYDVIRRIAGVALIIIGVAVAIHTIIEPLYHVSSEANPYSPIWSAINPATALAVVLGVIFGYARKRSAGKEGDSAPITREYLVSNTQFYGFLFVGILFFWNWFNILSPDFTGVGAETISLVWGFIDTALPLLAVAMGIHLARR